MQLHFIKKFLVLSLVAGALFSNSVSRFLSAIGEIHWAENFAVHEAFAAVPTYIASGTVGAGTGAVTPGLPAGILTNDILIMAIETANQAISIPTPNGGTWTQITSSPQGTGTAGGTAATSLTIFWSRYNGTQGAPTTSDSGDHQRARIYAFRGVINSGNPWDVTYGAVLATASTAISIPGGTTTATEDLIVATVSNGTDTNTAQCGGTWTNASLTSVIEIAGDNTNLGGGGGTCMVTGTKAVAGAFNPTTSSLLTSSTQGLISIALKPQPTTTIGDGTNPGNATLAPGGAVTDLDNFSLVASAGSDTVTALTVTLSPIGSFNNIAQVDITNTANTAQCTAITNPASDTLSFTGCTIPVSITAIDFKVRITPKTHANIPVPPGAQYATTGTVTAFTTTNPQLGTDTASATITIDNLSPGDVTATGGTAGSGQVALSWTNPADADYASAVVLRKAGSAVADTPVEGATYTVGGTIGTATVACVVATPTATCTDTGLTNGTAYYYEIFTKDTNGNYSVGVVPTGSPFTPAVAITVTSYTNTTETALNYAASCTGCGARIGPVGYKQTITITGSGFGADPGVGSRSIAANNIKIGTHQIADSNVTAWSATSITFTTNSSVVGDRDDSTYNEWGTEFGGLGALKVTAASVQSTGLDFYVFPQVTSLTRCNKTGFPIGDGAREYNVADTACPNTLTDGEVLLNGTRFGTASTTGYVQILGCDAITCSSPTGSATTTSWSNYSIQVQVPQVIADIVYTGSLVMKQGLGSNNKTHTYTTTNFRIFPRITTPSSLSVGDTITISGDHLCEAAAVCPTSFGTTDNIVVFTSYATSTVWGSGGWTDTAINTQVPTGTVTGPVVVTSNTYTSNSVTFTLASATPSDPTNLNQYKDSGLTQAISIGGVASPTPIYLTMTMQVGVSGGTLYPQVEYESTSTAFLCTGTAACGSAFTGTGTTTSPATGSVAITPADNSYHWQARVKHTKNATDYYSNWVSFPDVSPNGELITDFQIDTTPPIISFPAPDGVAPSCLGSTSQLGTNSVTISWTTNELANGQVEYGTDSNLAGSTVSPIPALSYNSSQSTTLTNLNSNTLYYFKVKAQDIAGNLATRPTSSPYCNFTTGSNLSPAKTTRFHIVGATSTIAGGASLSQPFSVVMPENATTTKSIFVEIKGVYISGASSKDVVVQVNSETAKTYIMPPSSTSYFKIIHSANAINVDPGTNTLTITPQANTTMYILSADVYVNYVYTP